MSSRTPGFQPTTEPLKEAVTKVGSLDPRLSRTNFFDGRLLTATDLIRDQIYLDERVLEVGRALGSGVVRGLGVSLSGQRYLTVAPGLALSEGGRVLELTQSLELDLEDRALIESLNRGRYHHFKRGIYAVTLQYTEIGSDAAEVYPAEPGSERESRFDSYAEGAEITLTALSYPLPSDHELRSRATLARHFLRNPGQPGEISDQAIALAMLAIVNDRPVWLDTHLLRRPLRGEQLQSTWQFDLRNHYAELYARVMQERGAAGMLGPFAAQQYFLLLPPVGELPLASVDTEHAVQHFFPEHYRVSIAPVRRSDLAVLEQESLPLPPLDLASDDPAEVIVLAPLDDPAFEAQARRLGVEPEPSEDSVHPNYWLHAVDLLQQRLTPRAVRVAPDLHTVWSKILVLTDGLRFLRRPARAAETQVSAVVLAHGFQVPSPGIDLEAQLQQAHQTITQLNTDIEEQQQQLADCQDQNTQLQTDIETAAVELRECRDTRDTLNDDLTQVTAKRDACQAELKDCRLQAAGWPKDKLQQLLLARGLPKQHLTQAGEVLTALTQTQEKTKFAFTALAGVHPCSDPLLFLTLEEIGVNDLQSLKRFANLVQKGADNPVELGDAIAEQRQTLGLTDKTANAWSQLAEPEPCFTGTPVPRDDIHRLIDERDTGYAGFGDEGERFIVRNEASPETLTRTRNILESVDPAFDRYLWKAIRAAHKNGRLGLLEELAVTSRNNPAAFSAAMRDNAGDLGLSEGDARAIRKIGSRFEG